MPLLHCVAGSEPATCLVIEKRSNFSITLRQVPPVSESREFEKLRYQTPTLARLGSVKELTCGENGPSCDGDGGFDQVPGGAASGDRCSDPGATGF